MKVFKIMKLALIKELEEIKLNSIKFEIIRKKKLEKIREKKGNINNKYKKKSRIRRIRNRKSKQNKRIKIEPLLISYIFMKINQTIYNII